MVYRQPFHNALHTHATTRPVNDFTSEQDKIDITEHKRIVKPRFSVIVSTYNRRSSLLLVLASLRKQTLAYRDFEVIVVDNGSTDGTFNAVQTYLCTDMSQRKTGERGWQAYCMLEQQNGLAYARNAGLKKAIGEIVVFLDDDIISDAHFLEHLQTAYDETGADAIGGGVELRWEAPRPHWFTNDLLNLIGYYMPSRTRMQLEKTMSFSNSCFSVKREALLQLGGFPPFLSKRMNAPYRIEIADLCRRLHKAGYTLWYEPTAYVMHSTTPERLKRVSLVKRAYWKGRSEVLADYTDSEQQKDTHGGSFLATLRSTAPDVTRLLSLSIFQKLQPGRTQISLSEKLHNTMEQARLWGRIHQQFIVSNHAPIIMNTPAILLIRADEMDATPLIKGLSAQGIYCVARTGSLPLNWIWRYRSHQEQTIGIIHFYRPGALRLNNWQRQQLLVKLWIAQKLGICIVSTDAGGWWQNSKNLHFLGQRVFEQKILQYSNIIHTYTRHPEKHYLENSLRKKTYFLPHPGLGGHLSTLIEQSYACKQLGLSEQNGFVYLCFLDMHMEREVVRLIEAFTEMRTTLFQKEETANADPQLILVGMPRDKKQSQKLLKRAALNSAIHLFLERQSNDLTLYLGAADAVLLPYNALRAAGVPEMAMLAYSYEKVVVVPDIPRFQGLLPPYAITLYDGTSHTALVQAMISTLGRRYRHTPQEAAALAKEPAWSSYAQRMLELYKPLLRRRTKLS